jgi:hypothetical protein
MGTVNTTADLEQVSTADSGRSSTAAPSPPQIDRDTFLATRGITAGVLLGAGLWVIILTAVWLIFG